jgi:hypothetical protein
MAWKLRPGAVNYNFVDMTGQKFVGCTVLSRAPNTKNKNAAWLVKAACGHRVVIQGIALRGEHKRNPDLKRKCGPCAKIAKRRSRGT